MKVKCTQCDEHCVLDLISPAYLIKEIPKYCPFDRENCEWKEYE